MHFHFLCFLIGVLNSHNWCQNLVFVLLILSSFNGFPISIYIVMFISLKFLFGFHFHIMYHVSYIRMLGLSIFLDLGLDFSTYNSHHRVTYLYSLHESK